MALSRHGARRADPPIWSGFVDALTTLLLVMLFVLTIFMVVQSVLRDTIDTQTGELDALGAQVAELSAALGLEQTRTADLEAQVAALGNSLAATQDESAQRAAQIATLSTQLADRQRDLEATRLRVTEFEAQVAALIAERDAARGEGARLSAELSAAQTETQRLLTEQEALNLAIAKARSEIDKQTEEARLAAARREALEAMVADLRTRQAEGEAKLSETLAALQAAEGRERDKDAEAARLAALIAGLEKDKATSAADAEALKAQLAAAQSELSEAERARLAEVAAAEALRTRLDAATATLTEAEKARLAEVAAAEALRARLANADAELTAMTLALEEQRKRAEETLTLLAAAQEAQEAAGSEAQIKAGLLEASRKVLTEKDRMILEERRKVAVLNEQIAALRAQLGSLQALLDDSAERDAAAKVQMEALGNRLNAALAQAASEAQRRLALEEAERKRLEAEKQDLERFRSEFFGQLSALLEGREGVRVVGDRFVFSSEVLFNPGSADLAPEGQAQIAGVVATLQEVAGDIPEGIDWIIRVDGHTDNVPLSGTGEFRDNWELSQARALSVVRYMIDVLGFPPDRLAATGFGEWQPVAYGDSDYARAQNRRIELKLTER